MLEVLHSERFVDSSPAQVYATLLDEGRYLASERTMYRLLAAKHGGVRERRDQLTHPAYAKPELLAERPNELWSWDITKLLGPGEVDVLLPVRDPRRLQPLRRRLDRAAPRDRPDRRGADRPGGRAAADRAASSSPSTPTAAAPMRSKPVAFLLADLGVTKTHSRPYTSTDNPYSEAHFKTLKYRPEFPERFDSIEQAREFCRGFFDWYNHEHRHSGIGLMTPAAVHYGRADASCTPPAHASSTPPTQRHPERFVRRPPTPPALPDRRLDQQARRPKEAAH